VINSSSGCGEKLIDSTNSATSRFRERFEKFLYEKVTRQTTTPSPSSKKGADNLEYIDELFFFYA
jgi:hypothetical protein